MASHSSHEATFVRESHVRALYRDVDELDVSNHVLRPAQTQFFFKQTLHIMNSSNQSVMTTSTFAYVCWYKPLDSRRYATTFDIIESPCYSNTLMDLSLMDILPVHCINSPNRCLY